MQQRGGASRYEDDANSLIDETPFLAFRLVCDAGNGMMGHGNTPGSSQMAQRTVQGLQPGQMRLAGSRQASGLGSNSPFPGSQGGGNGDNASETFEDDGEDDHYQRQLQNSYDDEEVGFVMQAKYGTRRRRSG